MNQLTLSHVLTALGGGQSITAFFLVLGAGQPAVPAGPAVLGQADSRAGARHRRGRAGDRADRPGHARPAHPDRADAGRRADGRATARRDPVRVRDRLRCWRRCRAPAGFADIVSGFSFGATVDPINGNPGGVFAELYALVGVMLFIAIGGDAWMLRGIARTFTLIPLTKAPQLGSLANAAELSFASIFTSALEVAAPVILALLITDVAFGMVSRVVPQMNVFVGRLPAQGRRLAARRRRVAAVPRRLDVQPDRHLGRHRAPRLLAPSHGRSRQDRKGDTQAQARGAQEGPGRQEHRPQRRGRARRPG